MRTDHAGKGQPEKDQARAQSPRLLPSQHAGKSLTHLFQLLSLYLEFGIPKEVQRRIERLYRLAVPSP